MLESVLTADLGMWSLPAVVEEVDRSIWMAIVAMWASTAQSGFSRLIEIPLTEVVEREYGKIAVWHQQADSQAGIVSILTHVSRRVSNR